MDPMRQFYLNQVTRISKGMPPKNVDPPAPAGPSDEIEIRECRFKSKIDWFDDFQLLFEDGKNRGLIDNILVHGSFGDGHFNSYSDLDSTLIISDGLLRDPAGWQSLARWHNRKFFPFLTRVDPLQHHGAFFLWSDLMDNYSEAILPIDVYRGGNAWAASRTNISLACHQPETNGGLAVNTLNSLVNSENSFFRYGYSLFQAKRFLSNLMLVPALYYTDHGQSGLKQKSFKPFYEEFGHAANVIRDATAIRSTWQSVGPLHTKIAQVSAHNYKLFRTVHNFFGSGLKNEMKRMSKDCNLLMQAVKARQE